jgi:hypothetical protein
MLSDCQTKVRSRRSTRRHSAVALNTGLLNHPRVVRNNPVNRSDPSGLQDEAGPYDRNGKRVLPDFDSNKGHGFAQDGRYLVNVAGQLMEPCIVCHGRGALGRYPGLTATDSYVGGRWYHSGSNANIIGNFSAGGASGFTLALPRIGNLATGAVRFAASPLTSDEPLSDSFQSVVDNPVFPTDRWEKNIEDAVYPNRDSGSLLTHSGQIGGELVAYQLIAEAASAVRIARLASVPARQSAGVLSVESTEFGGTVIEVGTPVSSIGSTTVVTSAAGTQVAIGQELISATALSGPFINAAPKGVRNIDMRWKNLPTEARKAVNDVMTELGSGPAGAKKLLEQVRSGVRPKPSTISDDTLRMYRNFVQEKYDNLSRLRPDKNIDVMRDRLEIYRIWLGD